MPDQRPNILLLHTDQQRWDTIGALNGGRTVTPNMDRLVRAGTTYTNAYTSSPFCMPARHDLLTGTSARHHGYYQNAFRPIADYGLDTLPRMLTWAGYQTIAIGKMHFWPEREHHGFNRLLLSEEIPTTWENDDYVRYLLKQELDVRCQHGVRPTFYPVPQISQVPEEHHGAAWVADRTIEAVAAERDRPFFIWTSWVGPHPPFYVPPEYLALYEGAEMPESQLTLQQIADGPASPEVDVTLPWVKHFKEGYFARVSLIDHHLGRILDALEESGQLENTLIIFTSDHGELLGDRRRFSKTIPYEGSTHIPLILCGLETASDKQVPVAVSTWDVAATILDVAGIDVPDSHPLIGTSLRDVDHCDTDRITISHLYADERRWVAAITARYKFIHFYRDGRDELYDLDTDPHEQHDLIDTTEYSNVENRLYQACVDFELSHGCPDTVTNGRLGTLEKAKSRDTILTVRKKHAVPWPFNWFQFPEWMNGYNRDDLDAILCEIRAIVDTRPDIHLPQDEIWRGQILDQWESFGGFREELQSIFAELDERA